MLWVMQIQMQNFHQGTEASYYIFLFILFQRLLNCMTEACLLLVILALLVISSKPIMLETDYITLHFLQGGGENEADG